MNECLILKLGLGLLKCKYSNLKGERLQVRYCGRNSHITGFFVCLFVLKALDCSLAKSLRLLGMIEKPLFHLVLVVPMLNKIGLIMDVDLIMKVEMFASLGQNHHL